MSNDLPIRPVHQAMGGKPDRTEEKVVQMGGHIYRQLSGERDISLKMGLQELTSKMKAGVPAERKEELKGRFSDFTKAAGRVASAIAFFPLNLSAQFRRWAWRGTIKKTAYEVATFAEKQELRSQLANKYARWGYDPGNPQSIADFLNKQIEKGHEVVDAASGHLIYFHHERGAFLFAERNSEGKAIVHSAFSMEVKTMENAKEVPLKGDHLLRWGRSFALAYDDIKEKYPEKITKLSGEELDASINRFISNVKDKKKDLDAEHLLFKHISKGEALGNNTQAVNAYLVRHNIIDEGQSIENIDEAFLHEIKDHLLNVYYDKLGITFTSVENQGDAIENAFKDKKAQMINLLVPKPGEALEAVNTFLESEEETNDYIEELLDIYQVENVRNLMDALNESRGYMPELQAKRERYGLLKDTWHYLTGEERSAAIPLHVQNFVGESLQVEGEIDWNDPENPQTQAVRKSVNRILENELRVANVNNEKNVNTILEKELQELDELLKPEVTARQVQEYLFKKTLKYSKPAGFVLDTKEGEFKMLSDMDVDIATGTYKKNFWNYSVGIRIELSKSVKEDIKNVWIPSKTRKKDVAPRRQAPESR